jgi:predicted nucleic acid-binding protein
VSDFLADTSIFVAREQGRVLGLPPQGGDARVSVATLTELEVGALRAGDTRVRAARQRTLEHARRFVPLVYDEPVGVELAKLLAAAREQGRRAGAMDAIIAATALVHDLVLWTQDDDFKTLQELAPRLRVHRS